MKVNLDETKNILLTSNSIKEEVMNILQDITNIEEHKSYFEISLPIFLDDSYRISLYLDKKQNIIYNNLYTVLEKSICENLGKQKDVVKDFLLNDKEFSEIKETLLNFGIDSKSLTLEYKLKDEDVAKQILIYSEMIKKYYNNLYNIILYRFETNKNKKHIYYDSFRKIIEEFKGKNKFKEVKYNGISDTPIYSNENITIAASKDFDTLAQFYIDLEDIGYAFKDKKSFIFCNNYKINSTKSNFLKKKMEKKNINIVALGNIKSKNELKEKIEINLKIDKEK